MTDNQKLNVWKATDRRRERFVAHYIPKVNKALKALVAPLFYNAQTAQSHSELTHIVNDGLINDTELIKFFKEMSVRVGEAEGLAVMSSLKSVEPIEQTKDGEVATDVGSVERTYFQQVMNAYASTHGAEKVTQISNHTREILRKIIKEASEQGESIPNTVKKMRDFFGSDLGKARATRIARTEVLTASSFANNSAGDLLGNKYGIKLKKSWLPTPWGDFREHHLAMATKKPIPFEDYYLVGGVRMKHPHDPNAPASEVINCRCSEAYIPI